MGSDFLRLMNPNVRLRVGHQHSQFWPILARFVDYYSPFWAPKAISMVFGPQGAITCLLSTLKVLGYSGPFRGLLVKSISMIDEPRGAFTCRSSTLTVLADSGLFRGVFLTVLGSQSDFHGYRNPRCAYGSIITTHIFG